MRNYEGMYILHPELSEEETKQHIEKFTSVIVEQGGVITKMDLWGKRRLAYEVKKLKEGYYVLVLFQGEPAVAQELERIFKITESVVRYLVVRLDDTSTDANVDTDAETVVETDVAADTETAVETDTVAEEIVEVEPEAVVETETEAKKE